MCGIAGIVGPMTERMKQRLRAMNACLSHRGPDSEGVWHSERVGLAQRRLAIIDLSSDGWQPMTDPVTGNVISYNGEIYNYRVLRAELEREGAVFRTKSDTEVVLRAYERWGKAALTRLRGMFAIMLWDARSGRVLLARDRVGIKPLYWAEASDEGQRILLLASEVRAILETGMVERRIDPAGLATFVWNGFVMGPGSFVKGINLLPAGTYAEVDPARPRIEAQRYWALPARVEGRGSDTRPAAEALRTAVEQHLIADVPVGVFLSGGVDSSAIAAMAARAAPGAVRTFNVSFDEAAFDESPYARRVAEQLGTDHHELRLTQGMFRGQLVDALNSLDQPTFDGINTYFVSRIVRESGIKVALAGTGGDELFGGYKSFTELPRLRRAAAMCRWLPGGLVRGAARAAARLKTGRAGAIPPQTRWGKLGDALTSGGGMVGVYQTAYALFTRDFVGELLKGEAAGTRMGLSAAMAEELEKMAAGDADLPAISNLELSCFLAERLLRDTDTASMAVALEVRVPLLDHELIEALAGLDDRTRYMPLGRKGLLREMALSGLDPATFDRPKSGFVLPLEVWCREGLRDEVAAVMNDRALCEGVGLDAGAVRRLWEAFGAGAPGLYWSRVWAIFILLWWSRRYNVTHG